MNVREFIALLGGQDQEAEVFVIEHSEGKGYSNMGGTAKEVPFDKGTHLEYTDFRGNQFVKPESEMFNARQLLIGVQDL